MIRRWSVSVPWVPRFVLGACWFAAGVLSCGVGGTCSAVGAEGSSAAPRGKVLRAACVYDPAAHAAANRSGRNHWDCYWREVVDELGLRADEISPQALGQAAALDRYATLIVGGLSAEQIPEAARANLARWVDAGGTLIVSAAAGLDDLCGNQAGELLEQPDGEFSCAATFALQPHPVSDGIHSALQPDQRLLIFSQVRPVRAGASTELARLFDRGGEDTGFAAVTVRQAGAGHVFYFSFSVPQTMWVLHQGRPVDRDYDGDNRLRRSDAIVIRPHSIEVAYADEILLLLQNMIGRQPHAFLHPLPPDRSGEIPDALFHWGGDDEGSSDGIQLFASNWLKARGLPYHINALPRQDGTFGLTPEDAQRIRDNGHELSLHFNFVDGFDLGTGFSREQVLKQGELFRRHFRQEYVCSVNHWTRWTGWVEPVKWMLEAGGESDNTFVHAGSPPSNPVNLLGFSSGTAFPFWFYDDWRGENRRIEFLEQPITAYECGYIGQQQPDFATVHKVVDTAVRYHQTMNIFHHPIYIANYPHCRAAIEEMLRYLEERKIRALHYGSDELYHWWKARSGAAIGPTTVGGDGWTFEVESNHRHGVVVKIPLGSGRAGPVTIQGNRAISRVDHRFGHNWLLVAVPAGKVQVHAGRE